MNMDHTDMKLLRLMASAGGLGRDRLEGQGRSVNGTINLLSIDGTDVDPSPHQPSQINGQ